MPPGPRPRRDKADPGVPPLPASGLTSGRGFQNRLRRLRLRDPPAPVLSLGPSCPAPWSPKFVLITCAVAPPWTAAGPAPRACYARLCLGPSAEAPSDREVTRGVGGALNLQSPRGRALSQHLQELPQGTRVTTQDAVEAPWSWSWSRSWSWRGPRTRPVSICCAAPSSVASRGAASSMRTCISGGRWAAPHGPLQAGGPGPAGRASA